MSVRIVPWKVPGKFVVDVRFRWPDNSKFRDRKVIDAASPAQARRWGERRETELRAKGKPIAAPPERKVMTVAAFAAEWLEKHVRASLQKRSGIEAKESILRLHILPFIGEKRLHEVTDPVRADLQAKWIAGGYQDEKGRTVRPTSERKTLNNRLTVLGAMLRKAVEWRDVSGLREMPCTIRLLKTDKNAEAGFYDHSTYERLVEAAAKTDPRHLAAILLAGDAGLRRGEILALNLTDIDFAGGRIGVRRSVYWRKKEAFEDAPKGGITKWVPMTARLKEALQRVRHLRGSRVLYADDGHALTPKIIKRWVFAVERRAGLPETGRLHVFRHSFASHLAMAGVPAKTIQELARHESLNVTMRYMHLSPSAKDEGIKMLEASRAEGGKPATAKTKARA